MMNHEVTFLTTFFFGENNEFVYAESLHSLAKYLINNNYNVYLLDIFRDKTKVACLNTNKIKKRSLNKNKILYCGFFGKPVESKKLTISLNDYREEFFQFLEKFNNINGVKIVNNYKTLKYNLSKQYILDYENEFNFYKTIKINSFNDLLKYNKDEKKYLVKPLVSERSVGSEILDGLIDDEKLKIYYNRFQNNGLIVQLYTNDFKKYGERKITFINGEYVFARKCTQIGDENLVCTACGSKNEIYKPSKVEIELGEKVYKIFNEKYDLSYFRLDVTSDRETPIINEIEALNPDLFIPGLYELDDLKKYHMNVKNMLDRHHMESKYSWALYDLFNLFKY